MDDDIAEVEQQPAGIGRPLDMPGQDALLLQRVQHLIVDGLELPLAVAAAYHEVISKAANLAGIEQRDVRRLLAARRLYRLAGNLYRFQPSATSSRYYTTRSVMNPI